MMDAGIATEENLSWLREKGFIYVVVARNKIEMPEDGEFIPVAEEKQDVRGKLVRNEETAERDLFVDSAAKAKKEEGIKSQSRQRFEEDMEQVQAGLNKKGVPRRWRKSIHESEESRKNIDACPGFMTLWLSLMKPV